MPAIRGIKVQTDFRKFLQDEFLARSERNKQYSLRAFSKMLGIGSSDLSKLINLKRRATAKLIIRLANPLELSKAQVNHFLKHVGSADSGVEAATQFRDLNADVFRIVADWYHFGILELMKLPDFSQEPAWLAKRLGISSVAVNIATERLIRVGFLKVNTDGTWSDGVGPTSMLSNFRSSQARRHLQEQILDLARAALQKVPITEREQSAVIMAIDSTRMSEAKALIDRFRRDMVALLAAPDAKKNRLAVLNLSLFPVNPEEPVKPKQSDATKRYLEQTPQVPEDLH